MGSLILSVVALVVSIAALVLMSPFVLLVLGITISVVRLGDFLSD